jgi:endothelin-converting enzyme
MREVYASVLERLLVIHYELEKGNPSRALVINDDPEDTWPPFPWPPWHDPDDDDDGHDDGPKDRPKNATILAEEVVKFERKLAQASLDLSEQFQNINNLDADRSPETFYTRIPYTRTIRSLYPTSLKP